MPVTYFEYYDHYMGTSSTTVKFTNSEWDALIQYAKQAIKDNKAGVDNETLTDFITDLEHKNEVTFYALEEALLNYFDSPRRPAAIVTALSKKKIYSGEWEEGSFAFSTTGLKAAKMAVQKIEAKHAMEDY